MPAPASVWQMGLELNLTLGVALLQTPGVAPALVAVSGFRPAHLFFSLLSPEGACVSHLWEGRAGLLLTPFSRGAELELCGLFLTWGRDGN